MSPKLEYSSYLGNVYVNLGMYEATGTVFVWGIEDVTGGAGNDLLVGDDQSNVLDGGAGNDLLVGDDNSNVLDGGFGRDLLIAGGAFYALNPDTLQGGGGEDILIAGWTLFDWDPAILQWLRDTWAGAGGYAERVAALSPYLNPDTVYSNWATGNVPTGGLGDPDWFFLRLGADSHDGGPGEELIPFLY